LYIKEQIFYPLLIRHAEEGPYSITIPKQIRDTLGIDERLRKLKKGERLRIKIIISLMDGQND